MRKKDFKPSVEEVLELFLWQCGDCLNIYTTDIENCPNEKLDYLIVRGVGINDR